MIRLEPVMLVEGKYDKIKLSVDKIKNKIEEEKGNNIKKEQE